MSQKYTRAYRMDGLVKLVVLLDLCTLDKTLDNLHYICYEGVLRERKMFILRFKVLIHFFDTIIRTLLHEIFSCALILVLVKQKIL